MIAYLVEEQTRQLQLMDSWGIVDKSFAAAADTDLKCNKISNSFSEFMGRLKKDEA